MDNVNLEGLSNLIKWNYNLDKRNMLFF